MLHVPTNKPISPIFKSHASQCTISALPLEKLQDFITLHKEVYWNLPKSQQHFYKYVQYHKLKKSVLLGNSVIAVTAPDNKTLLAGARLTYTTTLPENELKDMLLLGGPINAQNTSIIQTLSAHPHTYGQGGRLVQAVLEHAAQKAQEQGKEWLFGKLAWGNANDTLNNHASFKTFARNGFSVLYGPDYKGKDDYKSIIVARHLGPK